MVEAFWDRPYRTVGDAVARSLLDQVEDPLVRASPSGVGSLEQWVDCVDVLSRPERRRALQTSDEAMLVAEGAAPGAVAERRHDRPEPPSSGVVGGAAR